MDYRKFRQWSPPTTVGSVAYPSLEKSSLGQMADKAIQVQQELAAAKMIGFQRSISLFLDLAKASKKLVSVVRKVGDKEYEVGSKELKEALAKQKAEAGSGSEEVSSATKKDSPKATPSDIGALADKYYGEGKKGKGRPKKEASAPKKEASAPKKYESSKPHEFQEGPAKTAYEAATGNKVAKPVIPAKRTNPEEGVVGKPREAGKKAKSAPIPKKTTVPNKMAASKKEEDAPKKEEKPQPKLVLGKQSEKPRTLGVEKKAAEPKKVAPIEAMKEAQTAAAKRPAVVDKKSETKTAAATKKLQDFTSYKPRSGASTPHLSEFAAAAEANKPSAAGRGYSGAKQDPFPHWAETKMTEGMKEARQKDADRKVKVQAAPKLEAPHPAEAAKDAAWKQRMGATSTTGAKQESATGAAVKTLKNNLGAGQAKEKPGFGDRIKQAASALSQKLHSWGQSTPKTSSAPAAPTTTPASPSPSQTVAATKMLSSTNSTPKMSTGSSTKKTPKMSTGSAASSLPDAFAERHWDIQKALRMLAEMSDLLKAARRPQGSMGRATPGRPGVKSARPQMGASAPSMGSGPRPAAAPESKPGEAIVAKMNKKNPPAMSSPKPEAQESTIKPVTEKPSTNEPAAPHPEAGAPIPQEGSAKPEAGAANTKQEQKPKMGSTASGSSPGPAFGEGFAVGSIIGQETGGSRTGGTTPFTIGTQYGLQKLQQHSTPNAGGGQGYFPRMGAGGPRLQGTATGAGGGGGSGKPTQSAMRAKSLSGMPPVISGSRTFVGR